jgi:hypothetical protein
MDISARSHVRGFVTLLTGVAFAAPASGAMVNLTTAGASGVINGAIFKQIDVQPTGTGVIDSFVQQKPQGNGTTSKAYNTTENGIFDNNSTDNFNHSITLADVPVAMVKGAPYRQFLLDINESPGGGDNFLSLDEVQIFVGGTANSSIVALLAALLQHDGTLVYRMDAGADNWVALDYSLGTGSGSGDMYLLVPDTAFAGFLGSAVVTLYSEFGLRGVNPAGLIGNFGSSDGFEEWALGDPIPEPATCILAVGATLATSVLRRRGCV